MDLALPVTRTLAHRFAISIGGDDSTFKVCGFKADERISEPYSVSVELATREREVDFEKVLENDAVLSVIDEGPSGGEPRFFHGVVTSFRQLTVSTDGYYGHALYTITIEPDLALLRHMSDARIFQQMTVQEIVQKVLEEAGVRKIEWHLTRPAPKREFLCQLNESNYDFISRLLSEEGAYFWFEHTKDGHTLKITDRVEAATKMSPAKIPYEGSPGGTAEKACVSQFSFSRSIGSGHATQCDRFFKNPLSNLKEYAFAGGDAQVTRDQKRKLFQYPGRYKENDVGKDYTRLWLEAERALLAKGEGQSNIHQLLAGSVTELTDYRKNVDGKYLMVSVHHEGTQPQALEEGAGDEGMTRYTNSFLCIPRNIPFRAPRRVKPVVDGPQIATVVGPKGEEIFTDSDGRIKVKFQWDRYAKGDDTSSCWIRVSQSWAGPQFGSIAIPRIGQEVIIDFIDSDVDQPVVTGRTYNATNFAAYDLPKNKTRMSIKSKTHKGNGFNEIRFEDEKSQEEVYIHAEKDMNTKVLNNHTTAVDNNDAQYVGHSRRVEVRNNYNTAVGGSYYLSIGSSKIGSVVSDYAAKFAEGISNVATILGTPASVNPGEGNMMLTVEKNKFENVGITNSVNVAGNMMTNVAHAYRVSAGNLYLSGLNLVSVHAEASLALTSGAEIRFECGETSITLTKDGEVYLKGKKLFFDFEVSEINSDTELYLNSDKIETNGKTSIKLKSPKINFN